jgi:hypothetical protein
MTMRVQAYPLPSSRLSTRTGSIVSGLVILFLVQDAIVKLIKPAGAVEATAALGYPTDQLQLLGAVLLGSAILYAMSRTAVLGAILLTGYLGGAAAIQARIEDPWFLLPIALGVLAWVGLALRDARIRYLIGIESWV